MVQLMNAKPEPDGRFRRVIDITAHTTEANFAAFCRLGQDA
jgi:hypothetical protein